ncbi:MAG: hypothetical protein AUI47_09280 [Acidobacteria bacterium 13_1_40CM_2_68_5]|nr:MAG: hypothetical protein AUI47_09280 [Acidobacteria bacterium 13_1_40CM_2_68_5]
MIGVGARIAEVADAVGVRVFLSRVRQRRTIVERAGVGGEVRIAGAVAVRVGAGIAGISLVVVVRVSLSGIEDRRAVVTRISDTVAVPVGLGGVGPGRTIVIGAQVRRITGIPESVAVPVGATVFRIGDSVAVGIPVRSTVQQKADPVHGRQEGRVQSAVAIDVAEGQSVGTRAGREMQRRREGAVAGTAQDQQLLIDEGRGRRDVQNTVRVKIACRHGRHHAADERLLATEAAVPVPAKQ